MRTALRVTLLSLGLGIAAPALGQQLATAAGPSRATALLDAQRTYIVVDGVGHVPFKLGPQKSVSAKDGSTITAYVITNDYGGTADSAHAAVLLFRDATFLGWASSRAASFVTLEPSSGNAIRVRYPIWKGNDPTCCPSGSALISYSWNGSRIVANGDPPLIYGEPGFLLHLSPG